MSNYPDTVSENSPDAPWNQGQTDGEVDEDTRLAEIKEYLDVIRNAGEGLEELAASLAWLDANYPEKDRETILKRGYSFFLLRHNSGLAFLTAAISSLKADLRELRERVEDLA